MYAIILFYFQGSVEEGDEGDSRKAKGKVVKFGWIEGVYVSDFGY